MKTISLTQGMVAVVDNEDFDRINSHKWFAHKWGRYQKYFRAARNDRSGGKARLVYLHREVTGAPKGMVVDHINHDSLDNRKSNLRVVSQSDNMKNRARAQLNSKSGLLGVQLTSNGKFRVRVGHREIGRYKTKEEAVLAHRIAKTFLHGKFAGVK